MLTRLRQYAHLPVAGVLILGLWASLVWDIRTASPPVGDEVNWLRASADIIDLLASGAGPSAWEAMDHRMRLGSFGNLNPPVGKYMIGIFMDADARREALLYRWDFKLTNVDNFRQGNVPPSRVTRPVWLGISAYAALTLALLYLCALQVTGARWSSLAAPVLLYASPIFQFHATRVYTDVPQLCLMMASVVAFNRYLVRREPVAFTSAIILAGLATAVKFSAAPLVFAMALFTIAIPGSPTRRLLRAAMAGIVPYTVFVAVNPYLYPEPIARSIQLVKHWSQLYAGLSSQAANARSAPDSPIHGLQLVLERTVLSPDLNVPDWLSPIALTFPALLAVAAGTLLLLYLRRRSEDPSKKRQIATAGVTLVAAASQALAGIGLGPGLFAFGATRLIVGPPASSPSQAPPLPRHFLLVNWLLMWLISGAMLSLDWNRYYLRGITLTAIVFAAGIAWLMDLRRSRLTEAKTPRPCPDPPT